MIEDIERLKYERMWSKPEYRGFSPGENVSGIAHSMFKKYGSIGSLIDFGCGTGRAAERFKHLGHEVTMVDFVPNAVEVEGIDFVEACLWNLPHYLKSDNGFSSDVMEHIPPEKVEQTLDRIADSVSDIMFFQIALTPDSCGSLINETLHVTLWSAMQWTQELNKRWKELYVESNGYNLIYVGRNKNG